MNKSVPQKFRWILGVVSVWACTWALLGARAAMLIREQPHPFLKGIKLTGTMLGAVLEWALSALGVMMLVGLVLGFITLLFIGSEDKSHISYKRGLVIGSGTLLWVHGVLYLMVPTALATLPGLKHLPMGLPLLALLGGGAVILYRAVRSSAHRFPGLRTVALLATLTGLFFLPHDLFRRFMSGPKALPSTERRLVIVSFDALRKDVFEFIAPEWKTPGGATAICALPATRLTWNILLGASQETMRYSSIMPSLTEMRSQGDLPLLRSAESHGIRTAFIIDDSLTPAFGLQPNRFTTVLEPDGGWKYWFTLGFGFCWPVYSWYQNYVSEVETSNIWCDTNAYFRDIDRQLKNHGWVSSHNCELHAPILPRFEELRALSEWKWLWRPAYSYKAYSTLEELNENKGRRVGMRADPVRHFKVRAQFLLGRLKPFLNKWEKDYPAMSGVVTSDHGEYFAAIVDQAGHPLSHFEGIHGFSLDPDTIFIPMHPFGRTVSSLGESDSYSWLDLSDNISTWLEGSSFLQLQGGGQGHLIQKPKILTTHLDSSGAAGSSAPTPQVGPDSKSNAGNGSTQNAAGTDPKDFLNNTFFRSDGIWFCADRSPESKAAQPLSSAIILGNRISTFNPDGQGTYLRTDFVGYQLIGSWTVSKTALEHDLANFAQGHQLPPPPSDKK